jgi:hypothetical protein
MFLKCRCCKAECGAQNMSISQIPSPLTAKYGPHTQPMPAGNMKCSDGSDGNRENLSFWRPGRSRQYWTLKSTYQPDFFLTSRLESNLNVHQKTFS